MVKIPPCFEVELHGGKVPRYGALELALKVSLHLLAYHFRGTPPLPLGDRKMAALMTSYFCLLMLTPFLL